MAITNRIHDLEMMTCLIVDDDKFSRTFIKNALYQIGIKTIKEATTAKEAVELLNSYKIDIILLDQQMPDSAPNRIRAALCQPPWPGCGPKC